MELRGNLFGKRLELKCETNLKEEIRALGVSVFQSRIIMKAMYYDKISVAPVQVHKELPN